MIGVVAALTLPTLISNVNTKAQERKEKVFKLRLVHGLREMAVKSRLSNYDSTYDFAKELGQHYKYLNLCNSDNIQACYQVDEVMDQRGNLIDVSSIKSFKNLSLKEMDGWTNPVAIVTTDGTPFIFSYNKNCSMTESDINDGVTKDGTGVILNCIAGVYDRNGVKAPNKQGDDIVSFNGGILGPEFIKIANLKITPPFLPTPLSKTQCNSEKTTLGIRACYYDKDYWAGAVKQCGGVTKLPTMAQLAELAEELYKTENGTKPTIGAKQGVFDLVYQTNSPAARTLGLTANFWMWSGEEYTSSHTFNRGFYSNGISGWDDSDRKLGRTYAVCIVP